MTLRFLGFLTLAFVALSVLPATTATAETTPRRGATVARVEPPAYGPNIKIVNLKDLDTFSYKLHRELSGAAGQRIYDVYKDGFSDLVGFIPAKFPANGRFVFDWEGDVEAPDRYLQTLSIGANDWTEWGVTGKYKGKYNDNALMNLSERRNEVLFWWDSMTGWLDAYGDSLSCAAAAVKLVNDEQAIRCLAPNMSANAKIGLLNVLGMFSTEDTQTVSALTFELWLTKNDDIPVRMDVSATATDIKGSAFSGRFTLDVLYIDSDDIQVDLPR